jgi:hypothetical protein
MLRPHEHQGIDLALAVNYIPVCTCLLKSLALALVLCAVRVAHVPAAYVPLALLLLLDRLLVPSKIFDGNSLLLAIWGAHIVSELQAHCAPPLPHPAFLYAFLSASWVIFAVVAFEARRDRRFVPLALVAIHVAATSFVPVQHEPLGVRLLRYTVFPLLALGWLYFVGIHRQCLSVNTKHRQAVADSALHFTVRFAPILYVHPYAALCHIVAVVLVAAQWSLPGVRDTPAETQSEDPDTDELERVFRQAKSLSAAVVA